MWKILWLTDMCLFYKNFQVLTYNEIWKKKHDWNVYLGLLCFYKGYGYCNYNCVQVVKIKSEIVDLNHC